MTTFISATSCGRRKHKLVLTSINSNKLNAVVSENSSHSYTFHQMPTSAETIKDKQVPKPQKHLKIGTPLFFFFSIGNENILKMPNRTKYRGSIQNEPIGKAKKCQGLQETQPPHRDPNQLIKSIISVTFWSGEPVYSIAISKHWCYSHQCKI